MNIGQLPKTFITIITIDSLSILVKFSVEKFVCKIFRSIDTRKFNLLGPYTELINFKCIVFLSARCPWSSDPEAPEQYAQ